MGADGSNSQPGRDSPAKMEQFLWDASSGVRTLLDATTMTYDDYVSTLSHLQGSKKHAESPPSMREQQRDDGRLMIQYDECNERPMSRLLASGPKLR